MEIYWRGDITRKDIQQVRAALWVALDDVSKVIVVDLSEVGRVDSAGVALLSLLGRELEKREKGLRIVGVQPAVAEALRLFPFGGDANDDGPDTSEPWLIRIGRAAAKHRQSVLRCASILADAVVFTAQGIRRRGSYGGELSFTR